jgi:hypothetical protein
VTVHLSYLIVVGWAATLVLLLLAWFAWRRWGSR